MKFISAPYLPDGSTAAAVSAVKIPNVRTISPPTVSILPSGIRRHSDLGICVLGGGRAVCPPDTFKYYSEALAPFGYRIICGKQPLGSHYPEDTAYNVGIAGKKCFLNPKVCDGLLLSELEKSGFEIIPIKQGYAKCSLCPIDADTIICGDRGISREAERRGMTVLEVDNGGIFLEGYENGFFGGSAGMLSPDVLALNGELSAFPGGAAVQSFLNERKIKITNLKKGKICDIGSVIPLMIDVHNI